MQKLSFLKKWSQTKKVCRKFFCAIASLLFLMSFNAFAQIPSDKYLRISLSETTFSGIISNTQPDVQYEIQVMEGFALVIGGNVWKPCHLFVAGSFGAAARDKNSPLTTSARKKMSLGFMV
jgi:hypothetical protein